MNYLCTRNGCHSLAIQSKTKYVYEAGIVPLQYILEEAINYGSKEAMYIRLHSLESRIEIQPPLSSRPTFFILMISLYLSVYSLIAQFTPTTTTSLQTLIVDLASLKVLMSLSYVYTYRVKYIVIPIEWVVTLIPKRYLHLRRRANPMQKYTPICIIISSTEKGT